MAAGEEEPPAGSNRVLSWAARLLIAAAGLGAWFWSQDLIGERGFPSSAIGDGLLALLAPVHGFLTAHTGLTDALLIISSAMMDLLGVFLLAWSIFGPSICPCLGLLLLSGPRQVCQSLCALAPPEGMIWRDPGFPSPAHYDAGGVTWGILTADLDGDGDLDLAAALDALRHIVLLWNDGKGGFPTAGKLMINSLVKSLVAADLDGDGDLDLAVANHSCVSVLLNQTAS